MFCWGSFWTGDGGAAAYQKVGATAVPGWGNITSISVGVDHACAVVGDGGAECFGTNAAGDVGDGTYYVQLTPVPVTVVTAPIRQIVAGGNTTCVITTAGGLQCFGDNSSGQLGDGTTVNSPTPVTPIGMNADVQNVSLSWTHACAVKTDGTVYCWGDNYFGEIGATLDGGSVTTPTLVNGIPLAAAVRVGDGVSCAILRDGGVACWGNTSNDPQSFNDVLPGVLLGYSAVVDLAVGGNHICALLDGGAVQCAGDNLDGQLGTEMGSATSYPAPVVSLP